MASNERSHHGKGQANGVVPERLRRSKAILILLRAAQNSQYNSLAFVKHNAPERSISLETCA
jgi:hypothetical protein